MAEEKVEKPAFAEEASAGRPITDEIATAGKDIDVFAGWIKRLENPDPTLRTEAGGKGLKLYDEVDRDPHAGSVLQTRYLSVIGKEWEVLPGEEGGRGQEIADTVRSVLESTNFTQACQELLKAILYGFFTAEVLWQIKDGLVVPKKIIGKHPRRFIFTPERELRLLTLQSMIEGEPVPDRKFITFTYGSSDNPYGMGLGQKLWWPVWFKKHGVKFWLIFLEKFGMPTAVGKYPPGTLPEQQAALLDAIDAIQNETGVKIPDTMGIELLEASRTGRVSYEALCAYMDRQISKAVLGQTATTEGTPGKLGNEQAQENVRGDILKADSDLLCECLNDSLVKWIADYNFPNVTAYPKIWIRTQAEQDLKSLAERDKTIVSDIGVPVGRRYFYETYAIPAPEDGEELVQPALAVKIPQLGEFAESPGRFSKEQQAIDDLADRTTEQAKSALAGLTGPVKKIVRDATTFEEIRDRIYGAYGEMDFAEMEDLIARAMFAAELYGRWTVAEKMKAQSRQINNA